MKTFIEIKPPKKDAVCSNCQNWRQWGVATGTCFAVKYNHLTTQSETCKKFKISENKNTELL